MLSISEDGRQFVLEEPCGIDHRPQLIAIPLPPGEWHLEDGQGAVLALQRSERHPDQGLARIGIRAYEKRVFTLVPGRRDTDNPVICRTAEAFYELDNGKTAIRVSRRGEETGPVAGIRHCGGEFFGDTYFDTLEPVGKAECILLEKGPLRMQALYRGGNCYSALITLDAGEDFIEIEEEFDTREGDQLIWEFGGGCLPRTGYFLNSTPCFETRALGYYLDQELARLGCWSQQSQMNLSDGFAFRHPVEQTIWGAVAFEGGSWHGNRGNSLDAYMRRLRKCDRATRRRLPPGAKADALPGPAAEYNPVRDTGDCVPVLCFEGNLGKGRRKWGLILMTPEELTPPAGDDAAQIRAGLELDHFEEKGDKEFCLSLQSPLRKRHIEHILPFRKLLGRSFDSGPVPVREWGFTSASEFFEHRAGLEEIETYINARIITFYYGAGIASTNPVSSRRVAPYDFQLEELALRGEVGGERLERLRKRFLYLAMLNSDQGFYAGQSAMLPPCDPDSFDPPMKGMANQNFYTDVITIHGMTGLLYPGHPLADAWVEDFIAMFRRQLEVHTYSSGLWEESHTYCQHVLLTVLPVLLMLKKSGRFDFFAEERFQRMLGAVMEQISVADFSSEGKRALLPFGDHDSSIHPYQLMWSAYAEAFRECAPGLAARLNYMAKESGGAFLPGLPQTPPEPGNRELKGFGVLFRDGETVLALRSGCAWAHHHNDDGSIQLYCGDRMLIGDAGHSGRLSGPFKVADYGHSRWTLRGVEILNYHWRFNRGWVTASRLAGATPYATSYTPALFELKHGQSIPLPRAIRHFRSVVKYAENAFLVVDSTLEPVPERILFHFGAPEYELIPGGAAAVCGAYRVRVRSLSGITPEAGPVVIGDVPEREMTTKAVAFEPLPSAFFSAFLIDFGREFDEIALPEIIWKDGRIRVNDDVVLDHREACL